MNKFYLNGSEISFEQIKTNAESEGLSVEDYMKSSKITSEAIKPNEGKEFDTDFDSAINNIEEKNPEKEKQKVKKQESSLPSYAGMGVYVPKKDFVDQDFTYQQLDKANESLEVKKRTQEIEDKYSDKTLFDEVETTKMGQYVGMGVYLPDENIIEKPYEEELKNLKVELSEINGEVPSDEQLESTLRRRLADQEIVDLQKYETDQFIKSLTPKKQKEFLGKNRLDYKILNDDYNFDENQIKINKDYDSFIARRTLLEESEQFKYKEKIEKDLNDPNFIFGSGAEGEEQFTFNGKKVPKSVVDKYTMAYKFVSKESNLIGGMYDSYQNNRENYNSNLKEKFDLELEFDLLRRDYDSLSKNANSAYNVTKGIVLGGASYIYEIQDAVMGSLSSILPNSKGLAVNMQAIKVKDAQLQHRIDMEKERFNYAPDVQFKDAFKDGNFGEFLMQEISTQAPIIATMMATGVAGVGVIGVSSAGNQISDMDYEEMMSKKDKYKFNDIEYSNTEKFLIGTGFGLAEGVLGSLPTAKILKQGATLFSKAGKREVAKVGFRKYIKENAWNGVVVPTFMESSTEGLTSIAQNLITGRPVLENVGHAVFSGGLFGFSMSAAPVLGAAAASKFADYDSYSTYRKNISEMGKLNAEFKSKHPEVPFFEKVAALKGEKVEERTNFKEDKKALDKKLKELKEQNDDILYELDGNMRDKLSEESYKLHVSAIDTQEKLRIEAEEIINSDESQKSKNEKLKPLKERFDRYQRAVDLFKNPKDFGNQYHYLQESDPKQYDEIRKEAEKVIREDKDLSPEDIVSEKDLKKKSFDIYIQRQVTADIANTKSLIAETGLGSVDYLNAKVIEFQTAEEAQAYEDKRKDESQEAENKKAEKEKRQPSKIKLNVVKNSNGYNLQTADPNQKNEVVLIRDQMVSNRRTRTGVHEIGHGIFTELLKIDNNSEQMKELADAIVRWTGETNKAAYDKMFSGLFGNQTADKKPSEIVANFIERVADGTIDLKSKQSRGFTGLFSSLVNKMMIGKRGDKAKIDFQGETDVIQFIGGIAKKLGDGSLSKEDLDAIRGNKKVLTKSKGEVKEGVSKSEITPKMKEQSKRAQDIYDQEGAQGVWSAVEEGLFDPLISKIVNKRRAVPGYNEQEMSDRLKFDEGGLVDLFRTYDGSVPIAAYVAKILPMRAVKLFEGILKEKFEQSYSTVDTEFLAETSLDFQTTQEETTQTEEDAEVEAQRVEGLIDPRTLMDDDLSSKATEIISNNMPDFGSEGNSFKSLPDLSQETTAERFQIPAKKLIPKNNFTQGELKNTMRNLDEMFDDFVKIFPKGAVVDKAVTQKLYGTSTGLPTNVLTSFYKKGDRIDTASGLPIYDLAPVTKEQFRQELGILPDGTIPDKVFVQSPQAQTAKGLAIMFGKLVTNTTVREQLKPDEGSSQQIADIGAGKSELMLSQAIADQMYGKTYDGFKKGSDSFKTLNNPKDIKNAYKKAFGNLEIDYEDLILEQMEKSAKAWEKSKSELTLGEYIYEETLGRTFKRTFQGILGLEKGSLDFRSEKQIKSAREAFQLLINEIGLDSALKYVGPTVKGAYGLRSGGFKLNSETGGFDIVKGSLKYFLIGGRLDFFKNFIPNADYKSGSQSAIINDVETTLPTVFRQRYEVEFGKQQQDRIRQAEDQREGFRQIVDTLKDLFEKNKISKNDLGMILMTFNSNVDALVRTAAIPNLQIENLNSNKPKDYVYEHVKPARQVIQEILGLYILNKDGNNTTFDQIMEDFRVAIIPKTYDKIISKYFKSHLPKDANNKGIKAKMVDGEYLAARYNDKRVVEEIEKAGLPPLKIVEVKKQETKQDELSKSDADLSGRFNGIIEETKGGKTVLAAADKVIPEVIARQKGASIGKYKLYVPPSAEDFMGLMYSFMGKGAQGDLHKQFFEETLNKPYKRGIAQLESAKQKMENDYKDLRKKHPKVVKKLNKKMPGTDFTYDQAIRIFLWKSGGFDMAETGLEPETAEGRKLINDAFFAVAKDRELQQFARGVGLISGQEKGWIDPSRDWVIDNIASDLNSISDKIGRKQFLQEFTDNYKEIFNKQNLNKIEAIYGSRFRNSLEDILFRMEKGTNRNFGSEDARANAFADFLNGSVGSIMFFNMRSAALQTLSAANYVNWSDNNIYAAGKAFANVPQYYADVVTLFNSDKLKQRRKGFKMDVNQAELVRSIEGQKDGFKAALRYLLKLGFTPTQAVDSLAIATGGATFYRNRINTYIKDNGLTKEEAEAKAFEDFSEITDQSQQSSDPAMVSEQQANKFSRWVLSFQNTSMQYNRLIKKAALDIANNRGNTKENVSKILYYSFVQNFTFNALSSALFAVALGSSDDDEKDKQKILRTANGMADTILKGAGYHGAIIAMLKNTVFEIHKQESKSWGKDYTYVLLSMLNVAPAVGSKFSKGYKVQKTYEFQKDLIKERGFYPGTLNPRKFGKKESIGLRGSKNIIDNPAYMMAGYALSVVNIPLDRVIKKVSNASYALDNTTKGWQKTALMFGFSTWDLDLKNSDGLLIKERAQDQRKEAGYKKAAATRRKNQGRKMTAAEKRNKRTLELNK